jgi:hypothetical protein
VHCVICDTIKRTKKESYSRIRIAGKYLDKRTGKGIEGAKIHFVGAPDDDAYTYPDGSFAAYADRGGLHQTYLGSHNIRIQRNIDEALAANLQVHIDPENPPKKNELRDDDGDGIFCDGVDCTICK